MVKITESMELEAKKSFDRLLYVSKDENKEIFLANEKRIKEIFALSDFVAAVFIRDQNIALRLLEQGALDQIRPKEGFAEKIRTTISSCSDINELKAVLRTYRNEVLAKIAWRDMIGSLDLSECLLLLSDFAEAIIVETLDYLYCEHVKLYGVPKSKDGQEQKMLVIGMGKLGGKELNFSSDIDLIFCYPKSGQTEGARRPMDNQVFFTRLGQSLIQVLDQKLVEGQVYRVDMRLRPFGDSGPLVSSFAALEDYYLKHGRSWERYAMVKGRVLGETTKESEELIEMLRPFVFRRYLDFSAIESLRKMKSMIEAEVRRRGLHDNIKLGRGGIRELEFIAQVFQLMRGGRVKSLQEKHLMTVLDNLCSCGLINNDTYNRLSTSYVFLRKTENILQEIKDEQTQTLPMNEVDKERLHSVLGFDNYDDFYKKLLDVIETVHQEFKLIISDSPEEDISNEDPIYLDLWLLPLKENEVIDNLKDIFKDQKALEKFAQILVRFRTDCANKAIGPKGREILNKLLPYLIFKLTSHDNAEIIFERLAKLLSRIVLRTTYLQLITENPEVCEQLIRLLEGSELITDQLTEHPILLDELIMPKNLYTPTDPKIYPNELREFLMRVESNDLEQQMESLRQFKQVQLLRICASDLVGALSLMKVSDYLTYLAQTILAEVVNLTWNQLVEKYGLPSNAVEHNDKGVCVIAYGKLGGFELSYRSDLDLVFLCDGDLNGQTNGQQVISNGMFYSRFAQRLIHLFSTRLSSGVLYEVDARLRPDGDAGPLICSINGYKSYLENKAWTWEHQALVRARAVLGPERLIKSFDDIRETVIRKERDSDILRKEVVEMRSKMRTALIKGSKEDFDVKQGFGGMADIEFMAQYLVLKYAHQYPQMVLWTDNARIFEEMVNLKLLPEIISKNLTDAYLSIRNNYHKRSIQGLSRVVPAGILEDERKYVQNVWKALMLEETKLSDLE